MGMATISDSCTYFGITAHVGDFVFRGDDLGVVRACCQEGVTLFVVVDQCQLASTMSVHSSCWHTSQCTRAIWYMQDINECLAWKVECSQVVVIRM